MGSELGLTADTPRELKLDGLAIFYAVFACVWTLCLLAGAVFLVLRRDSPVLRIRGIPLSLCAVGFLHCYFISVQLGYMTGPVMPGDAEYWIMGTWLPLGIALFHASNTRFLHIAKAQRRFVQPSSEEKPKPKGTGFIARFRKQDHTRKVFILVGCGMAFQVFVTVLMYVISRKWHSSWGIPGTEVPGDTHMERKTNMGRGWEWWPSVFWQFFWAWIVAPVILWQSRGIHDTQGWRLQTIACCLSSLHATPMWLIALYVPQMEKVNQYFIPPQWIVMSIVFIEIFTIFIPCWQVLRHQSLKQETLDSIAQWENNNKSPMITGAKSITSSSTAIDSAVTGWKSMDGSFKSNSNESILTMGALEHVLERNPGPLLEFSALKDFSGENIAFLMSVSEWRGMLPPPTRHSCNPEKLAEDLNNNTNLRQERFTKALRIYADYISSHAQFQVNLPSPIFKKLETIFEDAACSLHGEQWGVDPTAPFESTPWERKGSHDSKASKAGSEATIVSPEAPGATKAQYQGEVPADFNDAVFEEAEASIKYLVLTNTWPKFVRERRSSMDSVESA